MQRTFGMPHAALVLLLTILAGCLRFHALDKPAIWGDEAATWRRVSGSYQQLVDELRTAGFMPGHYLVTWWIRDGFPVWGRFEAAPPNDGPQPEFRWSRRGRDAGEPSRPDPSRVARRVWTPTVRLVPGGIAPTPLVLRLVPALCGTLMVPAIYFLASRLVARRTALLAALFACTSAYLLNYSRDAKMYVQLWLFATLHVGCLLWWLEAYRRVPAVAVASRPWSTKGAEVGAGVAGVLTGEHVGHIARAFVVDADLAAIRRGERVTRLAALVRWLCWLTTGLAMIAFHTVGLAIVGIELLIVLATIPQRSGWVASLARRLRRRGASPERPGRFSDAGRRRSFASTINAGLRILPLLSFLVGATLIVGLFYSYRSFTRFYDRVEPVAAESTRFDLDDAGIGWVDSYNRGRTAGGHALQNATAYLFNWEWVKPGQLDDVEPVARERLRLAAIVLLIAIGAGLVPWRQLLDRMTGRPRDRGPMPLTAMLILGVWLLVPAYGFWCASGAWDDAGRRVAAPTPLVTIARALYPAAAAGDVEPLRGALGAALKPVFAEARTWDEARAELAALPWGELFAVRGIDWPRPAWWGVGAIATLLVVAALGWRRPKEPQTGTPVPPTDRRSRVAGWWGGLLVRAAGALLVIVLVVALMTLAFVAVPPQGRSVWMPRYLGFAWPAFAIVACVLIRRLPLAPVRWLVIAALVAVNLTNYWMRLEHGEPRTDLIATDQVAASGRPEVRVFDASFAGPGFGQPGTGTMFTMPDAYYAALLSGTRLAPREAYGFIDRAYPAQRTGRAYAEVMRRTLGRDAVVSDAYVWAQMPDDTPPGAVEANLRAKLPPAWQPAAPPERWTIYDHWTWRRLYVLERHHWRRGLTPATTRAVAPSPGTPEEG